MNSRAAALLLIGGISLLAASIPRRQPHAPVRRAHKTERPWLTREAQDQLIGEDGVPGPLFAQLTLGGPAPSPEQRASIAAFEHVNGIVIHLDVKDDTLVAIRASITFGGCCGYEAVDVLGRRLSRPRIYDCGDCSEYTPQDDWAYQPEPGVHVRFHTHVNTLVVRWEPALTTDEVLDAVEAMIGEPIDKLKRASGDRIREIEPHEYMLELPYDADRPPFEGKPSIGAHVSIHAGVVREVALELYGDPPADVEYAPLEKVLRARYGRPHIDDKTGEYTWHRHGNAITTTLSAYEAHATVTITAPGAVALQ